MIYVRLSDSSILEKGTESEAMKMEILQHLQSSKSFPFSSFVRLVYNRKIACEDSSLSAHSFQSYLDVRN